ncbi:type II toxin-antitoxin system VapC family toxin [bacterium]|nr:type II toxin-antitoxin system VapC family toxin [bacterium]
MADAYLLDTNIASALWDAYHAKHEEFRQRVTEIGDAPVYVSVVTLAEVEYGLKTAAKIDEGRQAQVRATMRGFEALPLDHHIVEHYAELRARLFRKHSPRNAKGRLTSKRVPDLWERTPDKLLGIQENDLWNAALAVERNLVFVTNDRMSRIVEVAGDDLRIERWG